MLSDTLAALGDRAPKTDLVFQFFAFFSRFEYALKRSGFLKNNRKAEPDWNKYANSLYGCFTNVDDKAFRDAIEFLLDAPPQTQVVAHKNTLDWEDTPKGEGEHCEDYVLRLVRVVRNNLFHGGKYPIPVGPLDDAARNEDLLNAGITILDHCLTLSDLRKTFMDP